MHLVPQSPSQEYKNMGLKEAYEERLKAQLREWEAEIAKLKARAEIERCDAQIAYYKQVESLQNRMNLGSAPWNGIRESGGEAWGGLRDGMSSTLDKLKGSLDQVFSRNK
jgi:hypothetical protein